MQHQLVAVVRSLLLGSGLSVAMAACAGGVQPAQIAPLVEHMENGIIDGTPSTKKDYPATGVILFITERYDGSKFGSMMCSATLIEPDVIMAAGHCDLSLFIDANAPIEYYFSRSLDVTDFGDESVTLPPLTTKIVGLVPHPDFDINKVGAGLRKTNDIALMYLEKPVKGVRPAHLIKSSEIKHLVEGTQVAIVGYGRRHNEERHRMDAGIKYQGFTHINKMGKYEMQVSPGSPQPHKCHGDSGGPTFLTVGKGRRARTILVGITSHAFDEEDCLHGGVDTRVDPYLKWVRTTLNADCTNGKRPACDGSMLMDDG